MNKTFSSSLCLPQLAANKISVVLTATHREICQNFGELAEHRSLSNNHKVCNLLGYTVNQTKAQKQSTLESSPTWKHRKLKMKARGGREEKEGGEEKEADEEDEEVERKGI